MTEPMEKVQLSGFSGMEESEMEVLERVIRPYADKFEHKCINYQELKITVKKVHEREHSEMYELHGYLLDNGKQYPSTITERNLPAALDVLLKKIENSISA